MPSDSPTAPLIDPAAAARALATWEQAITAGDVPQVRQLVRATNATSGESSLPTSWLEWGLKRSADQGRTAVLLVLLQVWQPPSSAPTQLPLRLLEGAVAGGHSDVLRLLLTLRVQPSGERLLPIALASGRALSASPPQHLSSVLSVLLAEQDDRTGEPLVAPADLLVASAQQGQLLILRAVLGLRVAGTGERVVSPAERGRGGRGQLPLDVALDHELVVRELLAQTDAEGRALVVPSDSLLRLAALLVDDSGTAGGAVFRALWHGTTAEQRQRLAAELLVDAVRRQQSAQVRWWVTTVPEVRLATSGALRWALLGEGDTGRAAELTRLLVDQPAYADAPQVRAAEVRAAAALEVVQEQEAASGRGSPSGSRWLRVVRYAAARAPPPADVRPDDLDDEAVQQLTELGLAQWLRAECATTVADGAVQRTAWFEYCRRLYAVETALLTELAGVLGDNMPFELRQLLLQYTQTTPVLHAAWRGGQRFEAPAKRGRSANDDGDFDDDDGGGGGAAGHNAAATGQRPPTSKRWLRFGGHEYRADLLAVLLTRAHGREWPTPADLPALVR
jgi:hypothetical protein